VLVEAISQFVAPRDEVSVRTNGAEGYPGMGTAKETRQVARHLAMAPIFRVR